MYLHLARQSFSYPNESSAPTSSPIEHKRCKQKSDLHFTLELNKYTIYRNSNRKYIKNLLFQPKVWPDCSGGEPCGSWTCSFFFSFQLYGVLSPWLASWARTRLDGTMKKTFTVNRSRFTWKSVWNGRNGRKARRKKRNISMLFCFVDVASFWCAFGINYVLW